MKKIVKNSVNRNSGSVEFSAAFDVIMTVVNKRRPYEPSDFVKEYFIPDI
jgi:hypothetical protein